jgi:hypothetical protein
LFGEEVAARTHLPRDGRLIGARMTGLVAEVGQSRDRAYRRRCT